jgi:hypothetical protein
MVMISTPKEEIPEIINIIYSRRSIRHFTPEPLENEETTHHTGLYVCREPRRPWSEMWKDLQMFQ